MCVPIKVESRLLGTLHIFRERGYHFNAEALRIAMSLADQAAIARSRTPSCLQKYTSKRRNWSRPMWNSSVRLSSASAPRRHCTAKDELEIRVAERTAELQQVVAQLHAEIAERQHTERELQREPKKWRKVPIGPRVNFSPT